MKKYSQGIWYFPFQAVYRNQLSSGIGGLAAQQLQLQLQQQQQYIQQLAAAGQIGGFPGAPYVINPGAQEPYLTLNLKGKIVITFVNKLMHF